MSLSRRPGRKRACELLRACLCSFSSRHVGTEMRAQYNRRSGHRGRLCTFSAPAGLKPRRLQISYLISMLVSYVTWPDLRPVSVFPPNPGTSILSPARRV